MGRAHGAALLSELAVGLVKICSWWQWLRV